MTWTTYGSAVAYNAAIPYNGTDVSATTVADRATGGPVKRRRRPGAVKRVHDHPIEASAALRTPEPAPVDQAALAAAAGLVGDAAAAAVAAEAARIAEAAAEKLRAAAGHAIAKVDAPDLALGFLEPVRPAPVVIDDAEIIEAIAIIEMIERIEEEAYC